MILCLNKNSIDFEETTVKPVHYWLSNFWKFLLCKIKKKIKNVLKFAELGSSNQVYAMANEYQQTREVAKKIARTKTASAPVEPELRHTEDDFVSKFLELNFKTDAILNLEKRLLFFFKTL